MPPPEDRHGEGALIELIERLRSVSGADLHLWVQAADGSLKHLAPIDHGDDGAPAEDALVWLREARYAVQADDDAGWAPLARDLLDQMLSSERQLASSRHELAEREEEVQLLHTVTETLGAETRLEDAASRILVEVVNVTGADRASLWIHNSDSDRLELVASEGGEDPPIEAIDVTSEASVSALAFREERVLDLSEVAELPAGLRERFGDAPGSWTAVPVTYTGPGGTTRTVGVLNLIGATGDRSRTGATRLLMTLARQVGGAVQNLKLFEESLSQERLVRELSLAHDLQMSLLPDVQAFQDIADVEARCVPARPVGGDFYQLFRLPEGRIGVLVGDVTSHGFSAALIMALSMSAAGIYARETSGPGELLRAIHRALIQKLESTEMFLTLFYGVVDPAGGTLSYSNAGHPHAFHISGDVEPIRLEANCAPLGIAEYGSYGETETAWSSGDTLCLFTDGLTSPSLRTTEQAVVDAAYAHRNGSAAEIISALFEARGPRAAAPDDQTALVLKA